MADLPDDLEAKSTSPNFEEEDERVSVGATLDATSNFRFISVSQIVTFDANQEGGCPRRWAFDKKKIFGGKKEPESEAQRKGKVGARILAHYLKTGEDCLPAELRAGKHFLPKPGADLEVEQELGDLERAVKMRDALLSGAEMPQTWRERMPVEIEKSVGLVAEGIPFTGAADVRHFRGEYVTTAGILVKEDAGKIVGEVGDHKMTSRISDYVSRKGEGKVYPGNAKTVEQISNHPQWLAYGVHMANRHPDLTHERLSAFYYQTKHGIAAEKRTILLEVGEVRERWARRVLPVVREMVHVAKAKKISEVPHNLRSCIQFNKPCPHSEYCDRPKGDIFDLLQIDRPVGGEPMAFEDLFGDSPSNGVSKHQPPPAVQKPQTTDDEHRAAVEAAKTKFQSDAAAPITYGYCASCGSALSKDNASRLPNGAIKHVGCANGNANLVEGPKDRAIGAVNPADGPMPDITRDAAALGAETIAKIEDPEIKARAEVHAAAVATKKAAEEAAKPAKEKTSGRCPSSGKKLLMTREESTFRKKKCDHCGKLWDKVKDSMITIEGGDAILFTVPSHNMVKVETPASVPAPSSTPAEEPPSIPDEAAPDLPDETAPELPEEVPEAARNLISLAERRAEAVDGKSTRSAVAEIARAIIAALEPFAKGA